MIMICVQCDQEGLVYHELIYPGQTVYSDCHEQKMKKLKQGLDKKGPNGPKGTKLCFCSTL